MRYKITYTPIHKEVLGKAINLAMAWHEGNIDPVCEIMLKAYIRHHPQVQNFQLSNVVIQWDVERIRQIDSRGEVFGDYEILKGIKLTDSGECILTKEEAFALEELTDIVSRLICGQLSLCFYWNTIPKMNHAQREELTELRDRLHIKCWSQPIDSWNGMEYDDESDILWDIHQVLRYERYLNFSDEEKEIARVTVLSNSPLHTSKIPLMVIETLR